MILITGGVYQGKLKLAKEIACPETTILDNCDQQIRQQVSEGKSPKEIMEFWKTAASGDKILIFNDVSMGIVPMDKEERIFRETVGKVTVMLAENADSVYRVFCGISKRIK